MTTLPRREIPVVHTLRRNAQSQPITEQPAMIPSSPSRNAPHSPSVQQEVPSALRPLPILPQPTTLKPLFATRPLKRTT